MCIYNDNDVEILIYPDDNVYQDCTEELNDIIFLLKMVTEYFCTEIRG